MSQRQPFTLSGAHMHVHAGNKRNKSDGTLLRDFLRRSFPLACACGNVRNKSSSATYCFLMTHLTYKPSHALLSEDQKHVCPAVRPDAGQTPRVWVLFVRGFHTRGQCYAGHSSLLHANPSLQFSSFPSRDELCRPPPVAGWLSPRVILSFCSRSAADCGLHRSQEEFRKSS